MESSVITFEKKSVRHDGGNTQGRRRAAQHRAFQTPADPGAEGDEAGNKENQGPISDPGGDSRLAGGKSTEIVAEKCASEGDAAAEECRSPERRTTPENLFPDAGTHSEEDAGREKMPSIIEPSQPWTGLKSEPSTQSDRCKRRAGE